MVKVATSNQLASEISKGSSIEAEPGNYYLNSVKMASGLSIDPYEEDNPPVIYMAAKHPPGPMLRGSSLKNIHFGNVIFDGNFANQPGAARGSSSLILCHLQNCSGIESVGTTWRNAAIDALNFERCHDILAEECTVHDLGHEFVYLRYGCYGATIRGCDIKTRTNSSVRISYGGSGIDVYDNYIHSAQKSGHTGPGIQADKDDLIDAEFWNNIIEVIYGSGIWMPGTGGKCKNVQVHHNTFKNVGKLPGYLYSQAALTVGGWDGVEFYNNSIDDAMVAVRYYDRNGVKGSFNINSHDNIIKNVGVAYDVRNSGGSITATRDEVSKAKSMTNGSVKIIQGTRQGLAGVQKNTDTDSNTDNSTTPIENTEETTMVKQMKYTLNVVDPDGNTIKVNSAADVQLATKQDGNSITGYVVFTTPSGDTTGRIPINAPLKKQ